MTALRHILWLLPAVAAAAGAAPVAFGIQREPVFQFARAPTVARDGDRVRISFAAKGFCDATVAIEDAAGRIVRHLVSGVLGPNAPPPFQKGTTRQDQCAGSRVFMTSVSYWFRRQPRVWKAIRTVRPVC